MFTKSFPKKFVFRQTSYPPSNHRRSRKQFPGVRQKNKPVPLYLSPFLCFKTGLNGLAIVRHGLKRACAIVRESTLPRKQSPRVITIEQARSFVFKPVSLFQNGLKRACHCPTRAQTGLRFSKGKSFVTEIVPQSITKEQARFFVFKPVSLF